MCCSISFVYTLYIYFNFPTISLKEIKPDACVCGWLIRLTIRLSGNEYKNTCLCSVKNVSLAKVAVCLLYQHTVSCLHTTKLVSDFYIYIYILIFVSLLSGLHIMFVCTLALSHDLIQYLQKNGMRKWEFSAVKTKESCVFVLKSSGGKRICTKSITDASLLVCIKRYQVIRFWKLKSSSIIELLICWLAINILYLEWGLQNPEQQ